MKSISFARWSNKGGILFTYERVYYKHKWTPFAIIKKRYKSWFGYWGINE